MKLSPPDFFSTPAFITLIALLVGVFYWLGTGNVQLFDWDEINFAQIAREMIVTDNFAQPTINYLPFHEKPPLFIWLQAASFGILGVSEGAARLPNVVGGGLTFLTLWYVGRRWRGNTFGWWWAAFMAFSLLPQLYFRSGIIDPWFNLFIFGAIAVVAAGKSELPSWRRTTLAGLLLGLAVLTKGPAAGLLAGLTLGIYLLLHRRSDWPSLIPRYLLVGGLALLPIGCWVGYVWTLDDGFFAREFLRYQWRLFSQPDAGHAGFPGYHVVVLLLGCFPASVLAISQFRRPATDRPERLLRILFWVVLVVFSLVSTKIVHYSSLAYFPLTFLAAARVRSLTRGGRIGRGVHRLGQVIFGLYALVLLLLPIVILYGGPWIEWNDFDYRSSKLFNEATVAWWVTLAFPLLALLYGLNRLYHHRRYRQYGLAQLVGVTYFVVVGLWFYLGPIQQLSQGPNVAFFQQHTKEQPYFGTAYFKSYVPLFYGRVLPENGGRSREFRFHGATDRPLYFSAPARRKEQVEREVPDAEFLYHSGGFAFFCRPASISRSQPPSRPTDPG